MYVHRVLMVLDASSVNGGKAGIMSKCRMGLQHREKLDGVRLVE